MERTTASSEDGDTRSLAAPSPSSGEGRSLVLVDGAGTVVRPQATSSEMLEAAAAYQALCEGLLNADDFTEIEGKLHKNKSAWRKLGVAFNVSDVLLERVIGRDERDRVIWAEVVVRATAPNGRVMDGYGACDIRDRCCPGEGVCTLETHWRDSGRIRHRHCRSDCDGRHAFSNPAHDIPSTAMTRATNRAFSDLFGMGEVSAEEIERGRARAADRETGEIPPERAGNGRQGSLPPAAALIDQAGKIAVTKGLTVDEAILEVLGVKRDRDQLDVSEARAVLDWMRAA